MTDEDAAADRHERGTDAGVAGSDSGDRSTGPDGDPDAGEEPVPTDRDTESDADGRSTETETGTNDRDRTPTRPDGGTDVEGADEVAIDPWGSSTIADYRRLFERFGIERFEAVLDEVPDPHYLMRRGVIFGHRDYRPVARAMREGDPFAALSGFMPTGDPHIGHKLVFDELVWHQQQGADAYGLIADLEAHSARGLSWEEIDGHARDYLLSLLALGFDPEAGTLYRQSTNRGLQDLAFELGIEANFSELENIYGFSGETDVSHMQSVVTQMADILYPQLDEPKPTVIPVGPDQDPHMRLARDLAARMRYFGVTEAYASFELDDDERAVVADAYDRLVDLWHERHGSGAATGTAGSGGTGVEDGQGATDGETDDGGDPNTDGDPNSDPDLRCVDAARLLSDGHGAVDFEERTVPETVTAAGPDADPERRAVAKLENAGREPLRPRVRILDRNATAAAFDALVGAVEGEKRVYEAHVDAFELSREAAERLARDVEVAHGGYGFHAPSSIYHRFMTGLTGGKMSSSVPASHISLLDDPEDGYDKVKAATTGGRETAELQRELGGEADECPVYELYAYLLAGDDDEYAKRVYEECVGGERLCGDCKEEAARMMREFLADHQEKRAEVEDQLAELDVELDVAGER